MGAASEWVRENLDDIGTLKAGRKAGLAGRRRCCSIRAVWRGGLVVATQRTDVVKGMTSTKPKLTRAWTLCSGRIVGQMVPRTYLGIMLHIPPHEGGDMCALLCVDAEDAVCIFPRYVRPVCRRGGRRGSGC